MGIVTVLDDLVLWAPFALVILCAVITLRDELHWRNR